MVETAVHIFQIPLTSVVFSQSPNLYLNGIFPHHIEYLNGDPAAWMEGIAQLASRARLSSE